MLLLLGKGTAAQQDNLQFRSVLSQRKPEKLHTMTPANPLGLIVRWWAASAPGACGEAPCGERYLWRCSSSVLLRILIFVGRKHHQFHALWLGLKAGRNCPSQNYRRKAGHLLKFVPQKISPSQIKIYSYIFYYILFVAIFVFIYFFDIYFSNRLPLFVVAAPYAPTVLAAFETSSPQPISGEPAAEELEMASAVAGAIEAKAVPHLESNGPITVHHWKGVFQRWHHQDGAAKDVAEDAELLIT